ncbi:MAG: alpha/beta hydrolase [Sphingomonadaceae bacterium]|nr:alpha/beta hydrolase [Sphingomonadaceae bacterium]
MGNRIVYARLPSGGSVERWAMDDRWQLRVMRWPGERGTLVVANGRGDFIEKYGEALSWWVRRGWQLIAFDWRGQGGSGRLARNPLAGASPGFDRWTADLVAVLARARTLGAGPLAVAAHSMGGHLALRAVAAQPGIIDRAVLFAPMVAIRLAFGDPLARLLARAASLLAPQRFAPGQRAWLDAQGRAQRAAALTTDAARAAEEFALWDAHPELVLGGATWGWLRDALVSCAALPAVAARITTPLRLILPSADRVVVTPAAISLVARLPDADYRVIGGAKHELWRERDTLRLAAFAAADEHLEQA